MSFPGFHMLKGDFWTFAEDYLFRNNQYECSSFKFYNKYDTVIKQCAVFSECFFIPPVRRKSKYLTSFVYVRVIHYLSLDCTLFYCCYDALTQFVNSRWTMPTGPVSTKPWSNKVSRFPKQGLWLLYRFLSFFFVCSPIDWKHAQRFLHPVP